MPVIPRDLPPLSLSSDALLPELSLNKLPLLSSPDLSSSNSKRDALLPNIPLNGLPLLTPKPSSNSKRDLPPLSLSSDALLRPLDILSPAESSSNSKRDLPPLSLSSDTLLAPLDILSPARPPSNSKRDAAPLLRLDSDKVLGALPVENLPLLSDDESATAFKRDLPPLSLSSDALLKPLDILDPKEPSSNWKRDADPLLRVDPDRFLKALPVEDIPLLSSEQSSSTSKRADTPLIRLESDGLFKNLPIENLQLNPLQSSASKREESDKSLPELPSDDHPPLVHVGAVEALHKLGKVDLLRPTDVLKRADEADQAKHPPFVSVNSLQFLDKLGKVDLLNPLDSLKRSDQAEDHSASRRDLHSRQNIIAIPTQYAGLNAGPAPGAVAGIVLGSVAGFLLIVWLLWLISNGGGVLRSSRYTEDDVVISRHRSRSPGTRRSHRSRRTEMTSRSPRRERVIRQERIVRDRSIPPPRETSRLRETVILDEHVRPERRVDGDDIVEVIEEHSSVGVPPPRRSKGRRSSGYR